MAARTLYSHTALATALTDLLKLSFPMVKGTLGLLLQWHLPDMGPHMQKGVIGKPLSGYHSQCSFDLTQ